MVRLQALMAKQLGQQIQQTTEPNSSWRSSLLGDFGEIQPQIQTRPEPPSTLYNMLNTNQSFIDHPDVLVANSASGSPNAAEGKPAGTTTTNPAEPFGTHLHHLFRLNSI